MKIDLTKQLNHTRAKSDQLYFFKDFLQLQINIFHFYFQIFYHPQQVFRFFVFSIARYRDTLPTEYN